MGLFRRKAEVVEPTFKEKVGEFWAWWSAESVRLLQGVDADGGGSLAAEVSEVLGRLHPKLAWVFGPSVDGKGHSFTISPEGDRNFLFLANYVVSQAPSLDRWEFHSSRQPSKDVSGFEIRIGEASVAAKSLWVTPDVDHEAERIDITAWSPAFLEIGDEPSMRILFLLLDEVLGEAGVETRLGRIEIGNGKMERSLPVAELREFVEAVGEREGWKKIPPEEAYSSYHLEAPLGDFPRGDTIAGTTRNMEIVGEYLNSRGKIEDPVVGSGASYVFIQFPRAIFPPGDEVEYRGELEGVLEEALERENSGVFLGGAMGAHAGYVDLLIFDGGRSRELISRVLDRKGLEGQYQFDTFARQGG